MGRARTEPKHAGAILRTAETAACALVCMCALACSRIHLGCTLALVLVTRPR